MNVVYFIASISWEFKFLFLGSWGFPEFKFLSSGSWEFHHRLAMNNVSEISLKFHWHFIDISLTFHWNFIDISVIFHWNFSEISFKFWRKISLKFQWNFIRIPLKFRWRFQWNFHEMLENYFSEISLKFQCRFSMGFINIWIKQLINPPHINHHRKDWQSKTFSFSIIWINKNKTLSGFKNFQFNAVSHYLPYTD